MGWWTREFRLPLRKLAGLDRVRRVYEALGRDDPLWAVLSEDRYRNNRWDPRTFFESGQSEIHRVMTRMNGLGLKVRPSAALDFGCGVGRLSQALCAHFRSVVGVDISTTMIDRANEYNRHGNRCRYVVNLTDRLEGIPDASIDFVYSNIALQHVPPAYQKRYIGEFFRVLRPGGVTVFQVRTVPRTSRAPLGRLAYALNREFLRPLWKIMRGRPPVQVHVIPAPAVEATIAANGGELREVSCTDDRERQSRKSLRFVAVRRLAWV